MNDSRPDLAAVKARKGMWRKLPTFAEAIIHLLYKGDPIAMSRDGVKITPPQSQSQHTCKSILDGYWPPMLTVTQQRLCEVLVNRLMRSIAPSHAWVCSTASDHLRTSLTETEASFQLSGGAITGIKNLTSRIGTFSYSLYQTCVADHFPESSSLSAPPPVQSIVHLLTATGPQPEHIHSYIRTLEGIIGTTNSTIPVPMNVALGERASNLLIAQGFQVMSLIMIQRMFEASRNADEFVDKMSLCGGYTVTESRHLYSLIVDGCKHDVMS